MKKNISTVGKKKKIFHNSIFPNAILQTQQLWRPLLSHTDMKRRWQRETNGNVWVWIHFIPSGTWTWAQFYISLGNNVPEEVVSHATLKFRTRRPLCWFSSTSTCPHVHMSAGTQGRISTVDRSKTEQFGSKRHQRMHEWMNDPVCSSAPTGQRHHPQHDICRGKGARLKVSIFFLPPCN